MTLHNLCSNVDHGDRLECPGLDALLLPVLEWLDGNEVVTLGEAIDRLQHLAVCRARRWGGRAAGVKRVKRQLSKRRFDLDVEELRKLRGMGKTYRWLAKHFNCSVGKIHRTLA